MDVWIPIQAHWRLLLCIFITCGYYHVVNWGMGTILLLRISSRAVKQRCLLMVCWSQTASRGSSNHKLATSACRYLIIVLQLWTEILGMHHEVMWVSFCNPALLRSLYHWRKLKLSLILLILSAYTTNPPNNTVCLILAVRIILR